MGCIRYGVASLRIWADAGDRIGVLVVLDVACSVAEQTSNHAALKRTLWLTLAIQLGFVLIGGGVLALLLADKLFLATPVIVIVCTWLVGLISFVYMMSGRSLLHKPNE